MRTRRPPLLVAALAGTAVGFLALPLVGLAARAPWSDMATEAGSAATAFRLSAIVSIAATAASVVVGVPLAWLLARVDFPGKPAVRAMVVLPVVLPPVVGGVALLTAFGRNGIVGRWIEAMMGIALPFTTAGAVLAVAFVALPFLVLVAEAGFRSTDRRYEEVAATLGAGQGRVFWRVALPLAAPSIGAGAVLAWARALGEFGATITFAGNLPGKTQTIPLAVFLDLQARPQGAIALSVIMVAISAMVLGLARTTWSGS